MLEGPDLHGLPLRGEGRVLMWTPVRLTVPPPASRGTSCSEVVTPPPASPQPVWSSLQNFFVLVSWQTQPVPNPLSYYLHRSPWWFHRFEVLSNHFIELVAPFFTFLGRRMCMLNGAVQILFQVMMWLQTSGMFSGS